MENRKRLGNAAFMTEPCIKYGGDAKPAYVSFASPPSRSLFYLEEQSFMISVLGISFVSAAPAAKWNGQAWKMKVAVSLQSP